MNKRTRIIVILLLTLVFTTASCGNKYGDAKEVLQKQANIFEEYINAMDKVESAEELSDVIKKFTEDMNAMIPRLQEIAEKYPDLEKNDKPPAELEPEIKKIEALSEQMSAVMMKCFKYMGDPKVQKALKDQGQTLNKSLKSEKG